jgi:hypothetical protein
VRKSGCKQANRIDTRAIVDFEIDASSCMRLRILAQHLDLPSATTQSHAFFATFFNHSLKKMILALQCLKKAFLTTGEKTFSKIQKAPEHAFYFGCH